MVPWLGQTGLGSAWRHGLVDVGLALFALAAVAAALELRRRLVRLRSRAGSWGRAPRVEDLTQYVSDPVLVTDADENVLLASDSAVSLLGHPREELLRKNVRDLLDPGMAGDFESRVREERTAGLAVFETRLRRKDGITLPVEMNVRVLVMDGQTYHQETIRDITERKRADEALALQAKLLDTLHDAVLSLSPDRKIRTWNAAAARLYGWRAEDVLGRDLVEVLQPEQVDGRSTDEIYRELAQKGETWGEVRQVRRDGAPIVVDAHAMALRDPSGAIVGFVVANRDITERRKAEEALRASEAKFRAAFHGAGMGMFLVDGERSILEFNQAFRTMLGYSLEEMRGMRIEDLLHPDDLPRSRAQFREMLDGERDSIVDERRFRRKDGSHAQAFMRATPVRSTSGEFLYSIGVVEDMTEKKALEAKLVFADRMSSIGTLAAGVAHEINNPLAFVVANVTFALEELTHEKPSWEELKRALEETRDGAERVREIVRDLKTFSRPSDASEGTTDVSDVIRSSVNIVQNEIRHRARLLVDLREAPPVAASPHRLGQVFVNLLINAAQSIAEGHAESNEIRVSSRSSADGRVLVEIADTGCGIPEESLERIFDPFFTTKPLGIGTGLGLSICHGIVTGLGGEIRVESRLGRGSTFRVLLPPAPPRPAPARAESERVASGSARPGRILVVDDEPLVGRAIGRVLAPAHQVVAVTSAGAALSRLEMDPAFDVVICDLMMPEMTGMELHEKLANRTPALSRRMLFLTGGAFTVQAREFLDRVPNPRLEKPFEPDSLRALVGDLLAQQG